MKKTQIHQQIFSLILFFAISGICYAQKITVSGNISNSTNSLWGNQAHRVSEKCVVQGTIKKVSSMPDPVKSDYPNCNYTAEIQGEWLLEGTGIQRNFIAVFPGFRDKKPSGIVYKTGEKVLLTLQPQEFVPEAEKVIQIADENENFDLSYFYVRKSGIIKQFSEPLVVIPFAEPSGESYATPANPPLSRQSQWIRKEQIKERLAYIENEIQRMRKGFSEYTQTFQREFPVLANNPNIINVNKRYMVWRDNSFFSINQNFTLPKRIPDMSLYSPGIASIIAFDKFCKSQNIDFVLVLVPELHEVALDVFMPTMRGYRNMDRLLFEKELLLNDIDVIDTTDTLIENRLAHTMMFRYNTMDYHPYDGTNWEAARLTASMLAQRKYLNQVFQESDFRVDQGMDDASYTKKHNAFPDNSNGHFDAGTLIASKRVFLKNKNTFSNEIIVLSNSFNTTPWGHSTFSEFLSYHCKSPVIAIFSQNSTRGLPGKFFNLGKGKMHGIKTCVMYLCDNHFSSSMTNLELVVSHTCVVSKAVSIVVPFAPSAKENHYTATVTLPVPEEIRDKLIGANISPKIDFTTAIGKCTGEKIKTSYFNSSLPYPVSIILKSPVCKNEGISLDFDIESTKPWKKITIEKIEYYLR